MIYLATIDVFIFDFNLHWVMYDTNFITRNSTLRQKEVILPSVPSTQPTIEIFPHPIIILVSFYLPVPLSYSSTRPTSYSVLPLLISALLSFLCPVFDFLCPTVVSLCPTIVFLRSALPLSSSASPSSPINHNLLPLDHRLIQFEHQLEDDQCSAITFLH